MSALLGINMSAKLGEVGRKRNDTNMLCQFRCTGCASVLRVEISGDDPYPHACVDCRAPLELMSVVRHLHHLGVLKIQKRKKKYGGKYKK